jgi:hypothetical protein|tara:strand:- start:578 stop:769 length:192 start_codon:yes stop_codon:yes gene_type:complete
MREEDLIEQRQYAQRVLVNLGIQPIKVDVIKGRLTVPKSQLDKTRKIIEHFDWPLFVMPLTAN